MRSPSSSVLLNGLLVPNFLSPPSYLSLESKSRPRVVLGFPNLPPLSKEPPSLGVLLELPLEPREFSEDFLPPKFPVFLFLSEEFLSFLLMF